MITRQDFEVKIDRDVAMQMRDGTKLYADIYSPQKEGTYPVLIMRGPYDKEGSETISYMHPEWYARKGYIIVTQDTRGKFKSEGNFEPYHHEINDGLDTIEFVKKLSNSNGKIGMYGFSYVGQTQLQPAAESPEGLTAIAPALTNDGYYENWSYVNGALHLAFLLSWSLSISPDQAARKGKPEALRKILKDFSHVCEEYDHLPLTDHPMIDPDITPFFYEWLKHPTFDEYWKKWDLKRRYDRIQVPALHIGGWYDVFIEGTLRNFQALRKLEDETKPQKLVVGPWYHMPWANTFGEINFGEDGRNFIDDLQLRWYDYWLKGEENGILQEAPIHIFVMGENKWRSEQEWPLARTQYTPFYIHSCGKANSLSGDGRLDQLQPKSELADIYMYNPFEPVPSIGGHSCCHAGLAPMGPKDQRPVEIRNDVLVYSTDVLQEEIEVTGPVEAVIYASSSAEDTDFTVKLVDVYPDGRAINLLEGIQRASFRDSNENPTPIIPGEIYQYRFHVGSTSNLFKKGHQIRIEISSSNFPMFDRNLNVFKIDKNGTYADIRNATQKIFHDDQHPTRIILPVIPR